MSRFTIGPVIGVHTRIKPIEPTPRSEPSASAIVPSGPPPKVDQLADFVGMDAEGTTAVFDFHPIGANDVPLSAIHVIVAPIPDGGVSPIPADVTPDHLIPVGPGFMTAVYRVPAPGEPETPARIKVEGVPFGASDWRTVFEYAE